MFFIECSITIKHIASTLPRVEAFLSTWDCTYSHMYEVEYTRNHKQNRTYNQNKQPRNHCVVSIEWYGTEVDMYTMVHQLKQISNVYVETCFDTDKRNMCYMSTYYSKKNHHRKNQYKW